jgi:hypothetical protein
MDIRTADPSTTEQEIVRLNHLRNSAQHRLWYLNSHPAGIEIPYFLCNINFKPAADENVSQVMWIREEFWRMVSYRNLRVWEALSTQHRRNIVSFVYTYMRYHNGYNPKYNRVKVHHCFYLKTYCEQI